MLKIALVRSRYNPFGGAERFLARAISALQAQGAEITLVTREWPRGGGIKVLVCNPFYLGRLWRDAGFARCAARMLRRREFDLVQSHERISCCDVYRAGDGVHREWLEQRRRVLGPLGRAAVFINPYHHYLLAAEKKLFASPRLKAVICNSRMVKDEIRRYFGVAQEKLHVVYSGVDSNAFHPGLREQHRDAVRMQLSIPLDATLFLFVGGGFERKGLATLLHAMAALPGAAYLCVVGRDKGAQYFENLARKLAIAERVRFVGAQEKVAPFYGAADALVLPTLYDPFPNVALEALAAGLPLVTSSKCGAAELINEGENGFVIDALDRVRLAQIMRQLLVPETRSRMAAYAGRSVAGMTTDAMAETMLGIYGALIHP